jgi:hypothetical protein
MSIKQNGGVFGRNPTFNDVTIEGDLIINGEVFTGLDFQGSWNASTNSPALASSVGTNGEFYIVSVAGATDLNGITNWGIGDWAIFNGTAWQRVEGGANGNFNDLTVAGTSTLTGDVLVGGASAPDPQLTIYKASTNTDVNYVKMRMESWGASSGKLKSIVWDDAGSVSSAIGAEYSGDTTNIHFHSQYNGGFTGTADRTLSVMGGGNIILPVGNLVIGTSGKGIDFSATAGTGTSELLDDYEEGAWTPTITSSAGTITSSIVYSAQYTKIGRAVTLNLQFAIIDNGTGSGNISVTGAPYTAAPATAGTLYNSSTGLMGVASITSTTMALYTATGTYPAATGQTLQLSITYIV